MRALRVLLAFLLSAGPVQAQPVVDLLSGYSIPVDQAAASASEGDAPPGSGKQLAALEGNLALLSEGLEGFAHPLDADKALLAAKPRLPSGTAPFFKDRATALDALYRTLAVVDYTWALRFPNPPCAPAAKRTALLRSDDGLFLDTFSGETSAWMTALLGPSAKGKNLESSLDQASASAAPTRAEYARLRARLSQVTKALAAEDAVGEIRAELYCKRAETRVKLAHVLALILGTLTDMALIQYVLSHGGGFAPAYMNAIFLAPIVFGWQGDVGDYDVLGAWFVAAGCGGVDLAAAFGPPSFMKRPLTARAAGYFLMLAAVYIVLPAATR